MAWSVSAPFSPNRPASTLEKSRSIFHDFQWQRENRRTQFELARNRHERSCFVAGSSSDGSPSTSSEYSVGSSARAQMDLLDQLASGSESESEDEFYTRSTIREQLLVLVDGRIGDFTIPLGKRLNVRKIKLTISQKRNIKRQAYLNDVSRRNDSQFFAIIGASILLPPVVILAIAILTGYVQLFP
ncbi:myosin-G heavy chain-like protein [Wolffia australiana]